MRTARVFFNGNSQAVRLPKAFRVDAREVLIRRDEATGDIVLSAGPAEAGWAGFFALRARTRIAGDFLFDRSLNRVKPARDPLAATARRSRPAV